MSESSESVMSKVVSLCKRRGFVFQSSEIYGGLKSCYDYGPLGVELKKNIADLWWRQTVRERENVYGLDASIMMHPDVWKASGHLSGFSDPLVDCRNCKERFRADKAPVVEKGTKVEYRKGGKTKGERISTVVDSDCYVCPNCGSNDLSDERQFNLMFRTDYGPVDPLGGVISELADTKHSAAEIREKLNEAVQKSAVYLRPETAQAMFVQFLNIQKSTAAKIPFGVAQIGKSFRNEIITEHFIFRSCEFEQMELEFFCEPGTQKEWLDYWKQERLSWYQSIANNPDKFRLRQHDSDELAHYSDDCYDIEYEYPWGWDELEGIASRTDYDLKKHAESSRTKIRYFDPQKNDPETGKTGWHYTPYVIEPAAGLTRTLLCLLVDAYTEETTTDDQGKTKTRCFLKLKPELAPVQCAVLPLVKKDGQPELARLVQEKLKTVNVFAQFDAHQSIGKRYAKHDEIGTPFCITIDSDSVNDKSVTVRHRDTCKQERVSVDEIANVILNHLKQ